MWRTPRLLVALAASVAVVALFSTPAHATVPPEQDSSSGAVPDTSTAPAPTSTTLPPGCTRPDPATAVFVGEVTAKDLRTARFQVVQVRAGSLRGYEVSGLVDVDYYDEVRYIDVGEQYIVGARANSINRRLNSRVRAPAPLFGGNDVVGVNDSETDCPVFEDPMRTLTMDGGSVESGVLAPMLDDREGILRALLVPAMWIFLGLVVLAAVKDLLWASGKEFVQIIRRRQPFVEPAPRRSHLSRGSSTPPPRRR